MSESSSTAAHTQATTVAGNTPAVSTNTAAVSDQYGNDEDESEDEDGTQGSAYLFGGMRLSGGCCATALSYVTCVCFV